MNEQEMMMKKKIEKREKFDTILAYIMIVILLACIFVVVYLKFIRKEDNDLGDNVDNTVTYISLNEISNSLSTSSLVNEYISDGAVFRSMVNGNVITANYKKDTIDFTMDMPLIGNELVIDITKDNETIVTSVYKEIATIICAYYGNDKDACRNTIDNAVGNSVEGIRFETTAEVNKIYLDITKKIDINTKITYNEKTVLDINDVNYVVSMNDTKIDNINIVSDETSIKLSGNIYNLSTDASTLDVVLTVYDENGNELGNNKYSYTDDNTLVGNDTFTISIDFNEIINKDNVKKYSIEVAK